MYPKIKNDDIMSAEEQAAQYEMEVKLAKIRVTRKIKPYIRQDSKIVYYCSAGYYKCHVPKALIRQDAKPPQVAKTENDLWLRLYDYLYSNNSDLTIQDMYDRWMLGRLQDKDVSSGTTDRDQQRYNKYICNTPFAKRRVTEIKPKDVKAFCKSITQGRQITRKELNSVKSILSGIFVTAIDDGVISTNPLLQTKTTDLKCKSVYNKRQVYTDDERQKLLDQIAAEPHTGYTLGIAFHFCQNMRIGEVKALQWCDVDLVNNTVDIYKEAVLRTCEDGKKRLKIVEHPKTEEGSRIQPLSDRAIQIIKAAATLNPDHKADDLIFSNATGNIMDTNKYNRVLKRLCDAAGIRYLSSHKMRFYAITAQIDAGFGFTSVMYNSGQKCPETTMGYIRWAATRQQNAEKWNDVFN